MPDFTDWLARNFFISEDDEATSAAIAANHQQILERQRLEGKVDALEYLELTAAIDDTGANLYDRELGQRGVPALFKTIPWWVWALAVVAAAVYFWPLIRPLVSRFTKRV